MSSYQTSNSIYGNYNRRTISPNKYSSSIQNNHQNKSSLPDGLQNLTNTCYMSSVFQNLFLVLNDKDIPIKYQSQQEITYLFFKLKKTKDVDDYKKIKHALDGRIQMVQGWQQQDAHQFLIQFIEQIRKQNSQTVNPGKVNLAYRQNLTTQKNWQIFKQQMQKLQKSKIIPIFYGQILRRFTCSYNSNHVKYNFQRYSNISLSFTPRQTNSKYYYGDKPLHVIDMMSQFLGQQIIEDLNCEQCKTKRKFIKQSTLYSVPKFLILHISRFIKGYYDSQKNSREVVFDEIIKIYQQCSKRKIEYKLCGVIYHIGSLNRGHYYTDIKINNQWFEMNDEKVNKTTMQQQNNKSKTAYLLIYQRN